MRLKHVFAVMIVTFTLFAQAGSFGQTSQRATLEERLQEAFQEWDRPDRLGGIVAVLEKGNVIYKKCFGQANTEYQLPNTSETVYEAGALAEPITGMAIAMLEEQGKLSPSDPIRKYIPELPDITDPVTVAHLLYHTSGLVDWFKLIGLAGWTAEDVITTDHVLKLLAHQKKLLFEPGSKYLHSSTDYALLAEVVKQVTGQSFRDWTWENIFKPLKMIRTLIRDNHREIIENRAYAINYSSQEGYLKGADNMSVAGSGSLYTTLDDFIKWISNLETPKVGPADIRDKMFSSGKLSDGKDAGHSYGFRVDTHGGLKRIEKSGEWGGFNSVFQYYPELSFAVAICTNWDYAVYDPESAAENIVQICLESRLAKEKKELPAPAKKEALELAPEVLARYKGTYRLGPGAYAKIDVEGNDLLLQVPGAQNFLLSAASETEFLLKDIGLPIMFQKSPDNKVLSFTVEWQGVTAPKIELEELSADQLKSYEGIYYNDALDSRYEIVLRDKNLVLTSLRGRDIPLVPENRKSFSGRSSLFDLIAFTKGETGAITGFYVDNDHLRQFVFTKIKP